jgi:hypothetical protein
MSSAQLLRLGSVVERRGGVLGALKHNKRTLPNDKAHIDTTRTPLNYSLTCDASAEVIARQAKAKIILAGIDRPRKNGVMAVEIIFSLPIERHQQDTKQFFIDSYEWTAQNFDGELLAFDVHLDESAPHAHALILPLIEGKLQGDKMKGDKAKMNRLQDSFFEDVARHHGLNRMSKARLTATDKQSIEWLVLKRLEDDPVMLSIVWPFFRDAIHKDPLPCAQMMGIELPLAENKIIKSFVDICRSEGKGTFIK